MAEWLPKGPSRRPFHDPRGRFALGMDVGIRTFRPLVVVVSVHWPLIVLN